MIMNKNLNLVEILKDCPEGTKLYSTICGEVKFSHIENDEQPIVVETMTGYIIRLAQDGRYFSCLDGECTLYPSKDCRDWSKFIAPWYKKEKFDPKTLKPFDKVLVRNFIISKWRCEHFSYFDNGELNPYMTTTSYPFCIPYNDETKHLVGTTKEAPPYYKYWEE